MKNLIIAKYTNGSMVKGTTLDVGNKRYFHLQTEDGQNLTIDLTQLKAVFFLKTDMNFKEAIKVRAGTQVRIQFRDGEEITGNSFDYNMNKDHFFVFPIDEKDGNERILVNRQATKFVSNLGSSLSGDPMERLSVDPAIRRKLEHEVYKCIYALAENLRGSEMNLDDALIATHCVLIKKKLEPVIEQYKNDFGEEAWNTLLKDKLMEIRMDLGEGVHSVVEKVVDRLH